MSILGQTGKFVSTHILSIVKPKQKELFSFGLKALSLTPYESLNSNARLIVENISTAQSKIYRLMSNKTLIENFHRLIKTAGLVTRKSFVNVDFSTFCGFQTLCFGVQTGEGRALPVWNNCLTYPVTFEGSQNLFVLDEIQRFGKTLGFFPSFVFDRGFWIPCVIKFLLKHRIFFYLRIKQGQELTWETKKRKSFKKARLIGKYTKDATINLYGYSLRLIISPPPQPPKNRKKKQSLERWYILTNDMKMKRRNILEVYKTRFEIEETFKDLKHIQKIKVLRIKTKKTFTILLWFASLAFWFAWWTKGAKTETMHPKKKRSFFRIFWEDMQRAIRGSGLKRIIPAPA